MSEDLSALLALFDGVGLSRGTMNGKPMHVVNDADGGHRTNAGQEQFLRHLRDYEARKGTRRSWRASLEMQMRASVAEARAKRRAAGA
jgi:hypothetical protein